MAESAVRRLVAISIICLLQTIEASAKRGCVGTDNDVFTYDRLKQRFQGCEIIQGNLELNNLVAESVNRTYDFLDSIQVINGFLQIRDSNATSIPLRSLSVIRGETLLPTLTGQQLAVNILRNRYLASMELTSLGSILAGRIRISETPRLCHWTTTILWSDVVKGDASRSTLIIDGTVGTQGMCDNCSVDCNGNCWGSSNTSCQQVSFLNCQGCGGRRCLPSNTKQCCHPQCVGGCTGPSSKQCLACLNLHNNGTCVSSCPPLTIFDSKTLQEVKNPLGKYAYQHECVVMCPDLLLLEGGFCVENCSPRRQIIGRACQLCKGPCPTRCNGTTNYAFNPPYVDYLHPGNSQYFENCTEISGSIRISRVSIVGSPTTAPISMADLNRLRSIRVITGSLFIGNLTIASNLSFLSNLREIIVQPPHPTIIAKAYYGFVVTRSNSLTSLSLPSLRLINGPSLVFSNPKLCYADTIDWDSVVPVSTKAIGVSGAIRNENASVCASTGQVCSSQCNMTAGCWGPSTADCIRCKNYRFEGFCRSDCNTSQPMYGDNSSGLCLPCHEECLNSCSGPLPSQCSKCRAFEANGVCLSMCPANMYNNSQTCLPCSDTCLGGCSGPGAFLGVGGCNNCSRLLLPTPPDTIITCILASSGCPNGTYLRPAANMGSQFFGKQVCENCHQVCQTCSGPKSTDCLSCVNASIVTGVRRECVNQCPLRSYKDATTRTCQACNDQCEPSMSCSGPLATDCDQCRNFRQLASNVSMSVVPGPTMEGLYECVEKCTNGSFKLVINVSSTCVDQCPADHYVAASDTCRACNILCSPLHGCSGQEARQCVRCRYAEQDDVCVAACPQGSVERNTTGVVNVKAPIQCQRQINVTDPGGNDPDDSPASIVGAGVGAGVGCVIAAVIVLVSLVYGRRRYNKWKKERQQDPSLELGARDNPNYSTWNDLAQIDSTLQPTPARKAPAQGVFNLIPNTSLKVDKQLGSGAYGIVYQGEWKKDSGDPVAVAIKVLNTTAASSAHKELLDESAVMISLQHVNLIQILGICMEPNVMMVSELAELGSLLDFLKLRKETLYGHNLLLYCQQICAGMQYLEEQSVIHCDLAARNVLVHNPNLVKLTDFGLARLLDVGQSFIAADGGQKLPIKWLAPETIMHKTFTHLSDVWSFGITCWEVLTFGNTPYAGTGLREILPLLKSGRRLPLPKTASKDLFSLITNCWDIDAEKRPRFEAIYQVLARMRLNPTDFAKTLADKRRQSDISAQSAEEEHRAASYLQPDFELIQEELAGNDADGYLPVSTEGEYDNGAPPTMLQVQNYDNTLGMETQPAAVEGSGYDNFNLGQEPAPAPCQVNESAHNNLPLSVMTESAAYENVNVVTQPAASKEDTLLADANVLVISNPLAEPPDAPSDGKTMKSMVEATDTLPTSLDNPQGTDRPASQL